MTRARVMPTAPKIRGRFRPTRSRKKVMKMKSRVGVSECTPLAIAALETGEGGILTGYWADDIVDTGNECVGMTDKPERSIDDCLVVADDVFADG